MSGGLTPAEHLRWFTAIKDLCVAYDVEQSDEAINLIIDDTVRRGRTLDELRAKMERKYGATPAKGHTPRHGSPARSAASGGAGASGRNTPGTPGGKAGEAATQSLALAAERATWFSRIKRLNEERGLGQTDLAIDQMMDEAAKRGRSWQQLYDKLQLKYPAAQPTPAYMPLAHDVEPVAPPPEKPPRAAESIPEWQRQQQKPAAAAASAHTASDAYASDVARDANYERIARFLRYHRICPTMAEAHASAGRRIQQYRGAGASSDALLDRLVSLHGPEPPDSYEPPADEERKVLEESVAPKKQPSKAESVRSASTGATAAATARFPQDEEAQRYFRRIQIYSKHYRLGQTNNDIEQLIIEQRKRGKPLEKIMARLVDRFGPEPADNKELREIQAAQLRSEMHRRLFRVLQYYQMNPTHDEVEALLNTCDQKKRPYDYILTKLVDKYGPEPPSHWVHEEPVAAAAGASHSGHQPLARAASGIDVGSSKPLRDGGRAAAYNEGLTMRGLALSRLHNFASHYGWKRTDAELEAMVDDAAARPGGYEAMFRRLVQTFGPEPTGPGVDIPITDADEERLMYRDKIAVYCAHYGLKKTEADIEKILDDYKDIGWDVLFKRMEDKWGPAPRGPAAEQATRSMQAVPLAAADPHWNTGAPSPGYVEQEIAAQRSEMLRQYSLHYRLGWRDADVNLMTTRHRDNFNDFLVALEKKYGPIPESASKVLHDPNATLEKIPRDMSAPGPSPVARRAASAMSGRSTRAKSPPRVPAEFADDRERFRSEYAFWMDRVRNLFELHEPALANDDDVDELLRTYIDRGVSFERMWSDLVNKYGPEAASRSMETTRSYWKGKFRHYCEYYNIHKSEDELERMLDEFKPKGWARMYDRLVELHGPPPPLPPTTLTVDAKMTPAQWRERLRTYCRTKFPAKSADEIELYLNQFEATSGSLESLYATLVLLHGLERPSDAASASVTSRSRDPATVTSSTPPVNLTSRIEREDPPPRSFFPTSRAIVRAHLTLRGLDGGLYKAAPPAMRQRFCMAVESEMAQALRIGDNHVHVQAVTPKSPTEAVVDLALSLPEGVDSRVVGDTLVRMVSSGTFPLLVTKRSYMEDLNGNALTMRASDVTVTEARSTLPNNAVARDPPPASSNADDPSAVWGGTPHRDTSKAKPPAATPMSAVVRVGQGVNPRSVSSKEPNFLTDDHHNTPQPSRIREIMGVVGDNCSSSAVQENAARALNAQFATASFVHQPQAVTQPAPQAHDDSFVRGFAAPSPDRNRVENPLSRLSDAAANYPVPTSPYAAGVSVPDLSGITVGAAADGVFSPSAAQRLQHHAQQEQSRRYVYPSDAQTPSYRASPERSRSGPANAYEAAPVPPQYSHPLPMAVREAPIAAPPSNPLNQQTPQWKSPRDAWVSSPPVDAASNSSHAASAAVYLERMRRIQHSAAMTPPSPQSWR